MGLDTSHDAWHGAYSSFGEWRRRVAKVIGIELGKMEGFGADEQIPWESLPPDPLHVLLKHSDCDGIIEWKDCGAIAERLKTVIDKVDDPAGGPFDRVGFWRDKTEQFINGCLRAFEAKENIDFH